MTRPTSRLQTRKFIQSSFVLLVATVALFVNKIDQGTFLALATLVLSIYGAANVVDKRMGGEG